MIVQTSQKIVLRLSQHNVSIFYLIYFILAEQYLSKWISHKIRLLCGQSLVIAAVKLISVRSKMSTDLESFNINNKKLIK